MLILCSAFHHVIISDTHKGIFLIKKSCLLLSLHFSGIFTEYFFPFWRFRDSRDVGRAIASGNWCQKVVENISLLHNSCYHIPCLIHHEGCFKVSRAMQKSLEVCYMMLPEDTAQSNLIFCHTHVLMQRGIQCRVWSSAVIAFEIRIYWTYCQISLSHDQNAYIVQYMKEGDFLVPLFWKDTLKSHYTQLFQCWIPYYYAAPREDAPGKRWNTELQFQMATTVDSMVFSSQPFSALQGLASLHNAV